MFKKGIFTISIDVELAWGTFDHAGHIKYKEAYGNYRQIIARLLTLFKEYEISATWAVVGHLFLDNCHRENGKLHPEIIRPRHRWFKDDWFSLDPGTDILRDEIWYGADIVKMIKSASPKQEIASHSFSHPVFADRGCSREAAEADIAKCAELAKREGIDLVSFVFPRNAPGHLDLLPKYGFRVFRGENDVYSRFKLKPGIINKVRFLVSDMLSWAPPVVLPREIIANQLTEIPASMLFRFAYGVSRFIPDGTRFKKAKKGIDSAVRNKKVFHLWFHPISFAWRQQNMFKEFERILNYAAERRKDGLLEIIPLRQVPEFCGTGRIVGDQFNPASISLHNARVGLFDGEYSGQLQDYYKSAFRFGRKKIENALLSFLGSLKPASSILDVGCGTGYYTKLVRDKGFRCVGIDRAQNMMQKLTRLYPEIPIASSDALGLPFAGNSFDAVITIETIRYFRDRAAVLKEIFRVIKPGGYIFITAAPLFSLNAYGIYNTFCSFFNLKPCISCHQSFETVGSLNKRLKSEGFTDINIRGYFLGPFYLLDKINPGVNWMLLRRFEKIDTRLSRYSLLRDLSNHLVCIARKQE